MLTSAQCRAARALLNLKQSELADAAMVSLATLANFETDKRTPYLSTLLRIREALEEAGVEFIPADEHGGPGVRLKN